MGTKGGISLASFCVFNPTYGPREGEVLNSLPYFIRFSFGKTLSWIKISTYIVGIHCFIFKDSCHYFFAGAQEDCIFLSQRDRHRHPDKTHWSLWGYSQIHRVCYPFKNRTLSFFYSNKNDFICKLNTFWYLQTCFSILQNIF